MPNDVLLESAVQGCFCGIKFPLNINLLRILLAYYLKQKEFHYENVQLRGKSFPKKKLINVYADASAAKPNAMILVARLKKFIFLYNATNKYVSIKILSSLKHGLFVKLAGG